MKTILYLTALLFLITNVSCTKNQDDTSQKNSINGKWSLRTINCFIAENNYNFPNGQITWTFNTSNSTVTILNNSTVTNLNFPTGVYNFTIGQNSSDNGIPCSEYLTIEGGNFGCITIDNNQLSLTSSNPDGINYLLTSNY